MSAVLTPTQLKLLDAIRQAVAGNGGRPIWASRIRDKLKRHPSEQELQALFLAG
jgi:hypothetical protein